MDPDDAAKVVRILMTLDTGHDNFDNLGGNTGRTCGSRGVHLFEFRL